MLVKHYTLFFKSNKREGVSSNQKMSIFKGRLTFVLFLLVLVSTVQKSHGCSKVKVGGGGGRYTGT